MNEGGGLLNKMNAKTVAIFVFSILLLAIGIYFAYKHVSSKMKPSYSANKAHLPSDSSNTVELLLFHVDWCPHCKHAMPEWEAAKEKYDGREINGNTVIFTDINCTNETPETKELMKKYGIQGFPTIKILKDGKVIDFDAKVTEANISKFLTTM